MPRSSNGKPGGGKRRDERARRTSLPSGRLAEILDHLQDVYYEATIEGIILEVSPSIASVSGFSRDELLGRNLFDFYADPQARRRLLEMFQARDRVSDYEVQLRDRDGAIIPCAISARLVRAGGQARIVGTMRDMRLRKQLEHSLQTELELRRAMNDLAAVLISEHDIEAIAAAVLELAKKFTNSPLGFVGHIDPASGHLVSSTMTGDACAGCRVPGRSHVFEHFRGLWGWVLRERQPLLGNDLPADPRSQGIPAGHLPIRRFLGVPAMAGDELYGEIALANKETPYNEADLGLARRLAVFYAIALERRHHESRLQETIAELERALAEVRSLSGLLPICSRCKKVRDDQGYWQQIESYISEHSEANFSHGLCPDCLKKLFPEFTGGKVQG